MDYKNLEKKVAEICDLIVNNDVIYAISILENIIKEDKNEEHKIELEKLKETYYYLLKYSAQNIPDPQRDNIYKNLQKSFLDLTDRVKEYIYTQDIMIKSFSEKRKIEKYSVKIINKINYLISNEEEDINELNKNYDELFNLFLFVDKYSDLEEKSILEFFESNKINSNIKCIMISGLTLNVLRCFDIHKINSLLKLSEFDEKKIKVRALIGLVLALYIHDERLAFYPEIKLKFEFLLENKTVETNLENIFIQFIKSKETEEIVKKLNTEIIPEMMKITPKINKKLNLDKIISDSLIEDKNPDWEEIFEDAPNVLNKMQQLSELQLEGSDVLMGTFSMLKYFPFFTKLKNWFVPFYHENPDIQKQLAEEGNQELYLSVAQGLEKSAYMCNSDKYSFFLNIGNLPAMQKNMIINLFKMESHAMEEIRADDVILNKDLEAKEITTQYIQDLYRFFKIHPLKNEFKDLFSLKLDFYNKSFFRNSIQNIETLRNIGELYFKKNYYEDAIHVFQNLADVGENHHEIFEKIAYSYQKFSDYENALENYKKAELFDLNKLWITKKIAYCYLKLNNYEKALEYYLKAEKENNEDLHVHTNIGLCYLNLEDFENALKHYFKVEYFSPSNIKVLRPIAWCSFVIGKFEAAIKYYSKLIEKESTKYDFINLGHNYLCKGDKIQAIENYKIALEKSENKDDFFKEFNDDRKYLLKNNIDSFELNFLLEYLKSYKTLENI